MSDHNRSFSPIYFLEGCIVLAFAVGLTWAYLHYGFQDSSLSIQGVFMGFGVALYAGAVWLVHLAFFPCKPVTQSFLAAFIGAGIGIAAFSFWLRLQGIA